MAINNGAIYSRRTNIIESFIIAKSAAVKTATVIDFTSFFSVQFKPFGGRLMKQ